MMKFTLPLALLTLLSLNSCATTETRDNIATMEQAEFDNLRDAVFNSASLAGRELGEGMDEDQRIAGVVIVSTLRTTIEQGEFGIDDVVVGVTNALEDEAQLEGDEVLVIQDVAKIIDAAVGQIRLGIDGVLSPREQELVFALLDGLANGLTRANG